MTVWSLPELVPSEELPGLPALAEARGGVAGGPLVGRPPGQVLAALLEAAPEVRAAVVGSGRPDAVTTCDLVTLPYPARFGLWRAARSPAPFLWFTTRMLVVQWLDGGGRRRTLLWEPSDHERAEYTPYFADLGRRVGPARDRIVTRHGTVLGHLRALGIDPAEVDYLAFDHLHTQDVRRHLGTTRPAPDLGSPDTPLAGWFPNARLLVQHQEWEAIRHLHPLQARWYQPATYLDLPADRIVAIDGDVLLGPGVALVATPGHTLGNTSLVLHADEGLWTSSENGVAAECWAPRASRIPGLAHHADEWGQDVILNANTIEFAGWQYDSMLLEAALADRDASGDFPLCFPSSELVAHPLAPMLRPTYTHGAITLGRARGQLRAEVA